MLNFDILTIFNFDIFQYFNFYILQYLTFDILTIFPSSMKAGVNQVAKNMDPTRPKVKAP